MSDSGLKDESVVMLFHINIPIASINRIVGVNSNSSIAETIEEEEALEEVKSDLKRSRSKDIRQSVKNASWGSDVSETNNEYSAMLEAEGQRLVDSKSEEYEKVARVRGEQLAQDWNRERISLTQAIDSCFAENLDTRTEVHAIREHFERAARAVTAKVKRLNIVKKY